MNIKEEYTMEALLVMVYTLEEKLAALEERVEKNEGKTEWIDERVDDIERPWKC